MVREILEGSLVGCIDRKVGLPLVVEFEVGLGVDVLDWWMTG